MANILSSKRLQIDKANSLMVAAVAVASFIVVFSLVASKALLSQRSYQARVISKKETARNQLKTNLTNSEALITSYKAFVSTSQNIIGGNTSGNGPKDGDSAKIILDALPSQYDFPALATSLDKLLSQNGLKNITITGTDDQLAQQGNQKNTSPTPVVMPFEISVSGSYGDIQNLVSLVEHSIRPFQVNIMKFSGSDGKLTFDMQANTFYQPEKDLTIKSVVVK